VFGGSGFGVGLTVALLESPAHLPPDPVRVQLSDALPVHARSAAEKVVELRRLQQLKAMLAAYELDLVAGLAADRPDTFDRRPGQPGAGAGERGGPGRRRGSASSSPTSSPWCSTPPAPPPRCSPTTRPP
jgi:hypothetical protein